MAKKIERIRAKLANTADVMTSEAHALRGAHLYRVSRGMVDVVLNAARSLPEWSPALAAPTPTGLLCWGKVQAPSPAARAKASACRNSSTIMNGAPRMPH